MAFVRSADANIYYDVAGSGPAILFAHGAGGNAAIWFEQVAAFSDRYTCIAFDHRGFARSPCDPASMTVPQFRDDAIAILDVLEVEKAHIVGQSMGGFTGLRMALDRPERVASLTLSCTPGGIPMPRPTEATKTLLASEDRGVDAVLLTMAETSRADRARMRLYFEINAFNTEFSWAKLGALADPETAVPLDALKAVTCPVQFIAGEEDPLFPPDQLAEFVPYFPQAEIHRLPDAGHSPYFERPDAFNRLLADFLARS